MWDKIFFNAQSIQSETDSSVLIKMPNKSKYNGWVFWHPKKLVRLQGGNGYHYSFSFHEDWEFTIKLYGRGKHNFLDVIRENIIDAADMKIIFGVVDENVNTFVEMETLKIIEENTEHTEVKHHIPGKKETLSNNEINELKK